MTLTNYKIGTIVETGDAGVTIPKIVSTIAIGVPLAISVPKLTSTVTGGVPTAIALPKIHTTRRSGTGLSMASFTATVTLIPPTITPHVLVTIVT